MNFELSIWHEEFNSNCYFLKSNFFPQTNYPSKKIHTMQSVRTWTQLSPKWLDSKFVRPKKYQKKNSFHNFLPISTVQTLSISLTYIFYAMKSVTFSLPYQPRPEVICYYKKPKYKLHILTKHHWFQYN